MLIWKTEKIVREYVRNNGRLSDNKVDAEQEKKITGWWLLGLVPIYFSEKIMEWRSRH